MALSNKNLFLALAALAAVVLLSSCAPYQARRTPLKYHAVGTASWYGPGFHGRKTSSGERFDQQELTAAHRTLPFGSTIKVTNIDNGKTVVVRVNDRGPFIRGRIIDLSKAAAHHIGMLGTGTARVELASLDHRAKEKKGIEAESSDEEAKPAPSKRNGKKWKFAPPPPPEDTQPSRPRNSVFDPAPTPGYEDLQDIRKDVQDKTGMPSEQDRF